MTKTRANGRRRARGAQVAQPAVDGASGAPSSVPSSAVAGNGVAALNGPPEDDIRARAYEIFLRRGGAPGYELEDWLAAERALRTAGPGAP